MSGTEIELPETMHIEGETSDEQSGERQKSPRELAMESIAARRQQVLEAELAQSETYDQEARAAGLSFPPEEDETIIPEPAPVHGAAQPTPPPAVVAGSPGPALAPETPQVHTVMFDGRPLQVTTEQLAHLAQLGMAANVALHQYQASPTPQPDPPPAPRPMVDAERARQVIKEIQYGGEDAAVPALVGFVEDVLHRAPQGPQIDPNALIYQAAQVARQQARLEQETIMIQQEYPDIFADPQRTMLAKLNVDAIRARNTATGRFQSDLDIYREAGNVVLDALGKPRPGSEVTQPTAIQAASGNVVPIRQDVIERKRAAPRATQVIDRRAPAPETPRPPSGSDIVDQMRRQRGQASMR